MWTVNFQMFKLDLEKAEEPEFELPTFTVIKKSKRVPENHLLLLYWLCQSLWLCGSPQTVEILKEMGIPDHPTCLLRNLYEGQEATVRTGHGATDWFQIRKGICQVWPRNAGLDEAQAGIKIAEKISITSDMQMTPPLWQKGKRN